MRILKLAGYKIAPAVASIYVNSNNKNTKYYNLTHGSTGHGLWKWIAGLDSAYFKVSDNTTSLLLDGDNYELKPIVKAGGKKEDQNGNCNYNITIDDSELHKANILLLWEIPNKNFKQVEFHLEGMGELIGEGKHGKSRREVLLTTPAPIIEIFGDVNMSWTGVDSQGVVYEQLVSYDYAAKDWNINPITKKE